MGNDGQQGLTVEKSEAGRLVSSEEIFRRSGFLAGWVTYERNQGHRKRGAWK